VRARNLADIEHAIFRALDDTSLRSRCRGMQAILRRDDAPEAIAAMVDTLPEF
jgi:UDP:flavonoid glycosyltransferase YjiC (YdhE family)